MTERKKIGNFDTIDSPLSSHIITQVFEGPILNVHSIFDSIKLSSLFPFASTNRYNKIVKNYTPSINDLNKVVDENCIIVKRVDYNSDITTYITIKVLDHGLSIMWDVHDSDEYKNIHTQIFDENLLKYISLSHESTSKYIRDFHVMNINVNRDILLDVLMRNDMFIIDDRKTSIKQSTSSRIRFIHKDTGDIKFSILPSYIDPDNDTESYFNDYDQGTPYLTISLKSNTDKGTFEIFKNEFCNTLDVYKEEEDEIRKIYKKYVPDFESENKVEMISDKKDKPHSLHKFPGYKKKCQGKRQPGYTSIVSDIKDTKTSMEFPPKSGNFYFCPSPKDVENTYKYIGLIDSQGDKYPCCFKTDQTTKKERVKKNKYGKIHNLPKQLYEYLNIRTPSEYKLVESDGGVNSFLQAVFIATTTLYTHTPHSHTFAELDSIDLKQMNSKSENTRQLKLIELRSLLIPYAYLGKQQMWNLTVNQIEKLIRSNDDFDPELFLHLLQELFQVNIIIIRKDMSVLIPKYTHSYYRFEYDKNILLYQNDNNYGVILHQSMDEQKNSINKFIFDNNHFIVKVPKNEINNLTSFNLYNKVYTHTNFPLKNSEIIKNQYFNEHGKVTQLDLDIGSKIVRVTTSPIPPFAIRMSDDEYKLAKDITDEDVDILLEKLNYPYNKFSLNNVVSLSHESLGNVEMLVQITNLNSQPSVMSTFTRSQHIAKMMKEYTLWYFSNNLDNKTELMTQVDPFLSNFIQTDTKYIYEGDITRTFSKDDNIFMKNHKMIVNDEELIKRLRYTLLHTIKTNRQLLYKYKNLLHPSSFYEKVSDFRKDKDHIIVTKSNDLEYLNNKPHTVQHHINISKNSRPYFFQFSDIVDVDKHIYIAQTTFSKKDASIILNNWIKTTRNVNNSNDDDEKDEILEIDTYKYIHENQIEPLNVKPNRTTKSKLLIIHVGNSTLFVCLLYVH